MHRLGRALRPTYSAIKRSPEWRVALYAADEKKLIVNLPMHDEPAKDITSRRSRHIMPRGGAKI
jgi:hypothetical protein